MYSLTRPAVPSDNLGNQTDYLIARSDSLPSGDSVSVTLNVSHSIWTLSVSPSDGGWDPVWWPYVVAATVVMSVLIALLVAYAMIARKQQGWMLVEVIVSGAACAGQGRESA